MTKCAVQHGSMLLWHCIMSKQAIQHVLLWHGMLTDLQPKGQLMAWFAQQHGMPRGTTRHTAASQQG